MTELAIHDPTNGAALLSMPDASAAGSAGFADQMPDTADACIRSADLLREHGKLADADAWLAATVARFPDSVMAATHYAWSAGHLSDWETALARWEAMLEQFPNHCTAMSGRGLALRELGRLDEADNALGDALLLHPGNYMAFVQQAWVSTRRRNWSEALERWLAFQERFPDVEYGPVGAAEALMELGRFEEAQAAVANAESRFPESAAARAMHATITERLRRPTSPVGRVHEIQESKIEASLPKFVANPEVPPRLTTSFAQGFIDALFQQMPIRFIQVGVNDAKLDDFLRWRCLAFGWTGLMIEPHPTYYNSARETYSLYPKLIWEQVAIVDRVCEKDLYFIDAPPADKPWAPGIASFDLEHMKKHGFADGEISNVRVKCLPLSEVIAKHCFYDVDLLVIDVEGVELDVIKSIDFSLFSVRLVVLETLHMEKEKFDEILSCFPPDYIGVYEKMAVDGVIYRFDSNYTNQGYYRG